LKLEVVSCCEGANLGSNTKELQSELRKGSEREEEKRERAVKL